MESYGYGDVGISEERAANVYRRDEGRSSADAYRRRSPGMELQFLLTLLSVSETSFLDCQLGLIPPSVSPNCACSFARLFAQLTLVLVAYLVAPWMMNANAEPCRPLSA